jgi:hypothetical protein
LLENNTSQFDIYIIQISKISLPNIIHNIIFTMGYTVIMLVTRKAGTTIEQFKDHYENKHMPLIMDVLKDVLPISHTRHYLKRNEAAKGDADVAPPLVFMGDASTIDYDCISKIELRDEEHFGQFNAAFVNTPRKEEIQADQDSFADGPSFRAFAIENIEVTKP